MSRNGDLEIARRLHKTQERSSLRQTTNGKRHIQVDNFSNLEMRRLKTFQNHSYDEPGIKLIDTKRLTCKGETWLRDTHSHMPFVANAVTPHLSLV